MENLISELYELDLSVRLSILVLCDVFLAVWVRALMVQAKPGMHRCFLFIPAILVNCFVGMLFNREEASEQTLALYSFGTHVAYCNVKILGFCFNRGPLAKVLDNQNLIVFCMALLFPANFAFDERPIDHSKKTDSDKSITKKQTVFKDVEFELITFKGAALIKEIGLTIFHIFLKMAMLYGLALASKQTTSFSFAESVVNSWFLYSFLTTFQCANELVILMTMRIKILSNFNQPYLATSVSSFWAQRWNLIFGQLMRDIFYEPVLEGTLTAKETRLDRPRAPRHRMVLGLISGFSASGLIHGIIMMQFMNSMQFPVLYAAFFSINAFIVIIEKIVKSALRQNGYNTKSLTLVQRIILIIYTQGILLPLGHYLFWPDLVRMQFIQPSVDGILQIASSLNLAT